jgi:hypothetical protein
MEPSPVMKNTSTKVKKEAQSEPKVSTNDHIKFNLKLIDAASIVASITALVYMMSYFDYYLYFKRLGVPGSVIDFQFAKYLIFSVLTLGIFGAVVIISDFIIPKKLDNIFLNLLGNIPISIYLLFGIFIIINSVLNIKITLLLLLICIGYLVYMTFVMGNLLKTIKNTRDNIDRLVIVSIFVMTTLCNSGAVGIISAQRVIEGTAIESYSITFNSPTCKISVGSDVYVLVAEDNNYYYIIKHEQPAPKFPYVLIIPRNCSDETILQSIYK